MLERLAEYLVANLLTSAILTVVLKVVFSLFGHPISWLLAAVIALLVVFLGVVVIVVADGEWD